MEKSVPLDKKQKTSKSRRETAVQGTNDNSIVSKCSMSAAGYFSDPFLKHFVAKKSKRAPLINRGYYLRAVCIDQVVKEFLAQNPGCRKQIISLGAGFDSAYLRLKAEGLLHETAFYEVDFPEVVKKKHAIIQSNSELSAFLHLDSKEKNVVPPVELSLRDYCLLGVDLTQLNTLEAALRLCGADFDTYTLLLSECVMTYMTRRCSSALVKWAGETFQDAIFVMFEQMNPDDAFGLFMQNHFHTVGSPLKCISSFPTLESQIKRFLDLGWQKCKCHDLNEIYRHGLSAEERARIETLDPFDEYEEFNLKCAHYFLLVAATSSSISDFLFSSSLSAAENQNNESAPVEGLVTLCCVPEGSVSIKRFSHSSVLVADRHIVTTGGFGEVDGRHQRVQEVSVTDSVTMQTRLIRCRSEDIQYSRMHHSAVALSNGRVMLIGGRQSPFFLCSQLLLMNVDVGSDQNVCVADDSEAAGIIVRNGNKDVKDENSVDRTSSKDGNISGTQSDHDQVTCGNTSAHENHESTTLSSCPAAKTTDSSSGENVIPDSLQRTSQCLTGGAVLPTELMETSHCDSGWMTCSVVKQTGSVPCPRWRHAATLVKIKGNEHIFLYGGRTQRAVVLADAYMLDVNSGVWTKVECTGDHPGALHSHGMVTWNEGTGQQVVLVVGGMDVDQCPQSAVYILDLSSFTWRLLHIKGLFQPRYSHTCHIVDNKLVVVGGANLSRQTPGIGIINLSTGIAQEFSFPVVSRQHLLMYHRHCSVMLPAGRLVILGGGGNCFSFGTHLNQTPVVMDISKCVQAVP